MTPRLVSCHCDPAWTAAAVCPDCERAELHALLVLLGVDADCRRGAANDALAASYRLDRLDACDRAADAAGDYEMGRP